MPDALPAPTVACGALTLTRAAMPDGGGDPGDVGLVAERPVVVYSAPGGERWGEYPVRTDRWGFWLAAEGDAFVEVVERRDGWARIVDDRVSWRLEGWVREEDLVETASLGTGGLGGRMALPPSPKECATAGPLYVVDGQGGVWAVGELAATDTLYAPTPAAAEGFTQFHIQPRINIRPGSVDKKPLSFAVESTRVAACASAPAPD